MQDTPEPSAFDRGLAPFQILVNLKAAHDALGPFGLDGRWGRRFVHGNSRATATVEAIEASSRTVTLKKPDGTFVMTVAGPEVKRFSEINWRQGQRSVLRERRHPTEAARRGRLGHQGTERDFLRLALPGGTKAQRTVTTTITAIDVNAPSITFAGPNGWKYSSKVQDKSALSTVKVGDKVDILWTEALLVSLEPGK